MTKTKDNQEKYAEAVFQTLLWILLLHRGSTLHTGTQRGHSFEGTVSMAGVAVVRGARDGPSGAVGAVDASKQQTV